MKNLKAYKSSLQLYSLIWERRRRGGIIGTRRSRDGGVYKSVGMLDSGTGDAGGDLEEFVELSIKYSPFLFYLTTLVTTLLYLFIYGWIGKIYFSRPMLYKDEE